MIAALIVVGGSAFGIGVFLRRIELEDRADIMQAIGAVLICIGAMGALV